MHLPPNVTIIIAGALNTGCSVLGGCVILYANRMDWEYDEFTGTAVQEAPNTFRVKTGNGQTSPSFTGSNGLKEGQQITVSCLKPTYYIVPPSTTPGMTARRLALAVAGMGGALLILSVFQKSREQMKIGNQLRGSGIVYIIIGLIAGLVFLTDGLEYIAVTGTAEDAGNNKFRVRFPEGHVSHDMDIPADITPPRFGSSFTVYRTDRQMVSLHQTRPAYYFLMVASGIVIASGLISVFLIVGMAGRTAPRVHPYLPPVPIIIDQPDTPTAVYGHPLQMDGEQVSELGRVVGGGNLAGGFPRAVDEPVPNVRPQWSERRIPGGVDITHSDPIWNRSGLPPALPSLVRGESFDTEWQRTIDIHEP